MTSGGSINTRRAGSATVENVGRIVAGRPDRTPALGVSSTSRMRSMGPALASCMPPALTCYSGCSVSTPPLAFEHMNDARARPAYLHRLAEFASTTKLSEISAPARDRARWVLADCIPVIAAGMQQAEMKTFVERHLAQAASGTAWVIGAGRRAAVARRGAAQRHRRHVARARRRQSLCERPSRNPGGAGRRRARTGSWARAAPTCSLRSRSVTKSPRASAARPRCVCRFIRTGPTASSALQSRPRG